MQKTNSYPKIIRIYAPPFRNLIEKVMRNEQEEAETMAWFAEQFPGKGTQHKIKQIDWCEMTWSRNSFGEWVHRCGYVDEDQWHWCNVERNRTGCPECDSM